ncbi:MAG: glycosyltransferase family 4 protein [Bacteroidia bacterium]|nr:glycosyltransferase family 4 protein [Bacteroidia bacterium]
MYNLAQIFIFPSLYEGFGLPPLEAMACGCPAIVSEAASLPEVCGEAALYFPPHNAARLIENIRKILNNDFLRQEQIQKGFQKVKEYTWKTAAHQHIKLIEDILKRNPD